jgi:hypothetical protein
VLDRVSPSLKERKVDAGSQAILPEDSPLHKLLTLPTIEANKFSFAEYMQKGQLLSKLMNLPSGGPSLVVNGRVSGSRSERYCGTQANLFNPQVIGPIEHNGIISADFEALCQFELERRVSPVVSALIETYPSFSDLEPLVHCFLTPSTADAQPNIAQNTIG